MGRFHDTREENFSPAYWEEHFVITLIDDLVNCLEFENSSAANIFLNSSPTGYFGTKNST